MGKTSHWPLTVLSTVVSLLQLFLPLTLVRMFSLEEIGTYKVFFLYYGLVGSITFTVGLVHGVYYWTHKVEQGSRLMQQVWSLLLIQALIFLVIGVGVSSYVSRLFGVSEFLVLIFVVSGACSLITAFYEEAWIAQERIWQSALFKAASEIVRAGLIVFCAWKYRDINLVFILHCVLMLGKLILGTVIAARQGLVRLVLDRELLREVFKYTLPVSSAGLLAAVANSADSLLLSTLLSKAEFAIFAMGCLSVPPLVALEQSVNQVLASRLSQSLRANQQELAVQQYADAVWELSRFMIPCFVGLVVFAEPIVHILFTSRYMESASVLRLYALSYLLIAIPYDGGPRASGQGGWALRTFLIKSVISVVSVALLTPLFGVFGAMSGVIISGLYLRLAGIRFNLRTFGWKLNTFVPLTRLLGIFCLSGILGLICWFLRSYFTDDRQWFAITGTGFSLIYSMFYLRPQRSIV